MSETIKYTGPNAKELTLTPFSIFEECEFTGIDFSESDLKSVSFLDARFTGCNLSNQSLINSTFRDVIFESCNLVGVGWCNLKRLENPKFYNCKLNLSSFQGLKLKAIEVVNCSAVEVDFSETDLSGSDFSKTNLAGANFTSSVLERVDFRSSQDYIFDLRTSRIKGAKFSFPNVLSLITALGAEVEI